MPSHFWPLQGTGVDEFELFRFLAMRASFSHSFVKRRLYGSQVRLPCTQKLKGWSLRGA